LTIFKWLTILLNQFARAAAQQAEQLINDSVAGFTWTILLAAFRDSATGRKILLKN